MHSVWLLGLQAGVQAKQFSVGLLVTPRYLYLQGCQQLRACKPET
jgi:hypothetical protein